MTKHFIKAPGGFFVLEGIDGAGKSTQIQKVKERLTALGYEVVVTREPGGCEFSESVRDMLKTYGNTVDPNTSLMLMYAARNEHLKQTIRPALEAGKIVLCDRYIDSSFTYQVRSDGADENLFYFLTSTVCMDAKPDFTYVFTVDPITSKERSIGARGGLEHYDSMSDEQRVVISETYQFFAESVPEHMAIDGTLPVDDITDMVLEHILSTLNSKET